MTPKQFTLIQDTFEKLKPVAGDAAVLFYDRLFALDPSLPSLFPGTREEQAQAWMQALSLAVTALRHTNALGAVLGPMCQCHGHGFLAAHSEVLVPCLLWTLERKLGTEFTEEVREAWMAGYNVLSSAAKPMVRAA